MLMMIYKLLQQCVIKQSLLSNYLKRLLKLILSLRVNPQANKPQQILSKGNTKINLFISSRLRMKKERKHLLIWFGKSKRMKESLKNLNKRSES